MMPDSLLDVEWLLRTMGGETPAEGDARTQITLQFGAGDEGATRFSGRSGCNRYFGQARIAGSAIVFGEAGLTRMACPPPQMALEARYVAALAAVTAWALEDGMLMLSGGKDGLVFVAAQPR